MWRRRVTKTDYLIHLKELERSITKIMTQFGLYYEYSHQRERQKRRKSHSVSKLVPIGEGKKNEVGL